MGTLEKNLGKKALKREGCQGSLIGNKYQASTKKGIKFLNKPERKPPKCKKRSTNFPLAREVPNR